MIKIIVERGLEQKAGFEVYLYDSRAARTANIASVAEWQTR